MTAPIAFVDIETTGLDPDVHEIWEVGLIDPDGAEHRWFLPVDLGRADPIALDIGGYHRRHPEGYNHDFATPSDFVGDPWVLHAVTDPWDFAAAFCELTRPRNGERVHLAGAVVSFDEERLRKLLRANGACPEWHYHLVDVEAVAAGWIAAQGWPIEKAATGRRGELVELNSGRPGWDSKALSSAVGVDLEQFREHEALEDARWAKAIYEAVFGPVGS